MPSNLFDDSHPWILCGFHKHSIFSLLKSQILLMNVNPQVSSPLFFLFKRTHIKQSYDFESFIRRNMLYAIELASLFFCCCYLFMFIASKKKEDERQKLNLVSSFIILLKANACYTWIKIEQRAANSNSIRIS